MQVRADFACRLGNAATAANQRIEAHRLFVEIGADGHAERLAKEIG